MRKYIRRTSIIVAALLVFGALQGAIFMLYGLHDNPQKADMIVVFGNTVNSDGSLSARLRSRTDAAVELYKNQYAPLIMVSGATGKEGHDEAEAMKRYGVSQGVPEEALIQDSTGYNTLATARNAVSLADQGKAHSFIIVSQYFHLPRAIFTFHRLTDAPVYHVHARYFELRDLYSLPREVIAFYKYLLVSR